MAQTVWVVRHYASACIVGVYTDEEKAKAAIVEDGVKHAHDYAASYDIDSFVLDEAAL